MAACSQRAGLMLAASLHLRHCPLSPPRAVRAQPRPCCPTVPPPRPHLPARRSQGIGAYVEGARERLGRSTRTLFTYMAPGEDASGAAQQQLVVSREEGCEFTTAGGGAGGEGWEEIRYPCQVYARVPVDLRAAVAAGPEVALEVGAVAL